MDDSEASVIWQGALKRNRQLAKQLDKSPKEINACLDMAHFELIDNILNEFRLFCVQTIWADLQLAKSEKTASILWTAHTNINHHYRRVLSRMKAPNHAVEKRKIEKAYHNFLRIALQFYKGLFQRLASRYDIAELRRMAEGIELEQLDVGEDRVSPVSDETTTDVLKLCHSTLLHMGDLSRYRVQARHKKSSYDTALAYYSLAHDLKPDSGFAFHQMGIVQLDEGRHLEIVYDFYRAWVVKEPHPNAEQNLKSEFKNLKQLTQTNSANTQSARPHDVFSMWFVKLHAFFYQGEGFPQHAELETEVMHRLRMASKNADSGEVLLKMVLINIAAYYVACKKFTGTQSESASRFCHYTSRLSIQFILVFSEVLLSELTEIVQRETIPGDEAVMTTPLIEMILPLLRTYMPWLTAHREEIFGAPQALGHIVPDMVKVLTKVFSLLCTDVYSQHLAACPYMLFEDLETRGFCPLRDDQIPESCRFHADEKGDDKPRLFSKRDRLAPIQETLGRILDILRCGYFLAGDATVPLNVEVGENALTFEYQEVKAGSTLEASEALSEPQEDPATQVLNHIALENHGMPLAANDGGSRPMTQNVWTAPPESAVVDHGVGLEPEYRPELAMPMPMMNAYTSPPINIQRPLGYIDESSYGMHSATANEILGQLPAVQPTPVKSVEPAKFDPLPWSWIYTPTPSRANDTAMDAIRDVFSAQQDQVHTPTRPNPTANVVEDGDTSPIRLPQIGYQRSAVDLNPSPQPNVVVQDPHRNQLLQSFQSAKPKRTSPFSSWGELPTRKAKEIIPPTYAYYGPPEGYPMSSGFSAFSHPSSLYHGTPARGGHFSVPSGSHSGRSRQSGLSPLRENRGGPTPNLLSEVDIAASNYDAAILRAAFADK